MTSLRTPHISAILLSAVAATLSACAGTIEVSEPEPEKRNGPTVANPTPEVAPSTTSPTGPIEHPTVVDSCITRGSAESPSFSASLSAGLNPTEPVDYVSLHTFRSIDDGSPEGTFVTSPEESAGTPCATAAVQETCRSDFAALTSRVFDQPPLFWYRFIITDERGARELSTADEIKAFLGTIDTFNEAALVLSLSSIWTDCEKLEKEGRSYVTEFVRSTCNFEEDLLEVTVAPDSTIHEEVIGKIPSSCVEGRLTEGVCWEFGDPHAAASVGEYLSGVCELETAAVAAFMQLADELKGHAAPEHLIQGALVAAAEEIGHAKATHKLATRNGSAPRPIGFRPRANRSLLEIAIENAAEGCVRELFGAACAHLQAKQARDPEIRAAWTRIAEEETRHAEWSLALDAWLADQLTIDERALVAQSHRHAVAGLRASTRFEPTSILVDQAGVPTSAQVNRLLDELTPLFG